MNLLAQRNALLAAAQELLAARDACAEMIDADDPAFVEEMERVQSAWASLRAAVASATQ